ncbi:alpha/beta hydrolase [Stappia indica]|uniref:alpha/beta hydrolase n=1 Tax=Stappia indica TaxID=538381 RepID=UPI001CD244B2|nr:alpha/beta hydrolase [Stappia indica]MCA1297305.1 alpha/beta hydrolase [Stappia indica]
MSLPRISFSPRPRACLSAALLALALTLAACSGRPGAGSLALSTAPAPEAQEHTILIATTRERDDRPGTYFNRERADKIDFARATVSIPPTHKAGQIEWPAKAPGNPETDFTVRSASYIDGKSAFRAALDKELAKRPKGKREVFVFIHGYNTRFPEALFRMAQLTSDSRLPHVPVLFTWASGGDVTDYIYDNNSATIARDALEETLRTIAASKAEKINILAHSMGNWALMETARQIRISGKPLPQSKIGLFAMAAPDLDVDVFKAQLRRTGKPDRPFILLASKDDRALKASSLIAGGKQRVGAYDNEEELAELGVTVVDLTQIESLDAAHHGKFAQLAQLAPEFRKMLAGQGRRESGGGSEFGVDSVGDVVGSTAKAAVTLPLKILTAPITIFSGAQ